MRQMRRPAAGWVDILPYVREKASARCTKEAADKVPREWNWDGYKARENVDGQDRDRLVDR